ncbi:MAG: hypothetical protein U9R40_06430, partial [Synergistota bacterium]|nr:hypothetical protein [Synergistota bacterium]
MIPWEEIENHDSYKSLDAEKQSALKSNWFKENVELSQEFTGLAPDKQEAVKGNFFKPKKPQAFRQEELGPIKATDYPKLLASGVGHLAKTIGTGQMWTSPGQMFARGLETAGEFAEIPVLEKAGGLLKEHLPSGRLRKFGEEAEEHWQKQLSEGMKQRQALPYLAEKEEPGVFGPGIKSGHKILGKLVQSAPETILGMLGGAWATKLIQGSIKGLSKSTAGMIGAMIGEGLTAGAGGAVDIYDKISEAPEKDLEKTGIYKKIRSALPDFIPDNLKDEYAQKILALSASGFVGTTVTALTAAFGAPSGAAMGKIIGGESGKNIWSTVLKQAFLEGFVQEFPQSGAERLVDNFATKVTVNPEQDLWEGVSEEAVGGAISGAIMGAGMAPAYRAMQKPADKPATTADRIKQDIVSTLEEGLTTGQVNGATFTTDNAMQLIKSAKDGNILTTEDIDDLKARHPALYEEFNEIISNDIADKIAKETEGLLHAPPADAGQFVPPIMEGEEDAARIRREAKAEGAKEGVEGKKEEPVHLRRIEKDRVEAKEAEGAVIPTISTDKKEETGEQIATDLGVLYKGPQEDYKGDIAGYLFKGSEKGSTVMV